MGLYNIITPEVIYRNYYIEFLYKPIKIFYSFLDSNLKDNHLKNEKNVIEYYLTNEEIFKNIFYLNEDTFFKSFYTYLIKTQCYNYFRDFINVYFSCFKYELNIDFIKSISNQENVLICIDLPLITLEINRYLFKYEIFSDKFINFNSLLLMQNFRPNLFGVYSYLKKINKNDSEFHIYVGNDLNFNWLYKLNKNNINIIELFV